MRISVIGGTGRIGARVVPLLAADGHQVRSCSRSTGVDLLTGAGLAEALADAEAVVDLTQSPTVDEAAARFFETATGNLLAAAGRAGVGHAVLLSIVGVDLVPGSDYYRAKVRQEELFRAGPVPYSVLRATQFFEFVEEIMAWTTEGGTVRLPATPLQPVAADDVARAVAELATGAPLNGTLDLAGPQVLPLDELGRLALAARGADRTVSTDPTAGPFARTPDGALLAGPGARIAATRYRDWLATA
ncbi:SDR family oxidoreductase [Kitasatospora sp. LaBMicrA B282]|uniref:SDR family oxidoreductase n=1 Tax=Kitasatospora sp. LaBMicrA B282 TaxID=3420949 RepID=UPI003D0AF99E